MFGYKQRAILFAIGKGKPLPTWEVRKLYGSQNIALTILNALATKELVKNDPNNPGMWIKGKRYDTICGKGGEKI